MISSTMRPFLAPASRPRRSGAASARCFRSSRRATRSCCTDATSCRLNSIAGMPHIPVASQRCRNIEAFLRQIGYLLPEGEPFSIETGSVDPEIARIAGPQLVVPVDNARYALNAANARWGSLYDALYGTDAIAEDGGAARSSGGYNPVRGAKVIAFARSFLDEHFALTEGSHRNAVSYGFDAARPEGQLGEHGGQHDSSIRQPASAIRAARVRQRCVLLVHHGLHVELHFDRSHPIGRNDPAGVERCDPRISNHDHPGLRGLGGRGRRGRQGAGVSQLARSDARYLAGQLQQGRHLGASRAQSRSSLPHAAR